MGTITRPGYEYVYSFCVDEELLTTHQEHTSYGPRTILVEVRTNFKIRRNRGDGAHERYMCTERFGSVLLANFWCGKETMDACLWYRLEEYWMPENGIRTLVQGAFDFAVRLTDDPNYASFNSIPLAVHLDVYTVQLEDEPPIAAIQRTITPSRLIPIYLWDFDRFSSDKTRLINPYLQSYLVEELPRIRVEDVGMGLALMDECSICLRGPRVGAHVTLFPDCNHAFHSHCVIRWLLMRRSCPLCRSKIQIKKKKSRS